MTGGANDPWPELPYAAWKDTIATLQLWTQIVGKIAVATRPWTNHSWHVTLHLSARGLETPLLPVGDAHIRITFDFVDHRLRFASSTGATAKMALAPMTVADFYAGVMTRLDKMGATVRIDKLPNEIPGTIPFDEDRVHGSYDPEFASRFWRILLQVGEVFGYFRTGFLGKVSPVHFFWGGFDLAVTRFSGRRAPLHPGGIPNFSDAITREAYSHEVSSAGFWPGGSGIDYAAFYSYAYPQPKGFAAARVRPAQAFYDKTLGEFLLPYDAVRQAPEPAAVLLQFLQSTYVAAAKLGKWDRAALECAPGEIGKPRPV